jgi:hypothetical protein
MSPFSTGFHKRMVGLKASAEENLVREKGQHVLILLKKKRMSHELYDHKKHYAFPCP